MGKKKKMQQNDKFNFEDDYIIGISDNKTTKKKTKKSSKKTKTSIKDDDRNNIATGEIDINVTKEVKPKVKSKPKKETIKIEKKKREPVKVETQGDYRLLKILLVICGLLLFVIFLRFSPSFNLNTIVIENNYLVSQEEIEGLLGVEKGTNLFALNKKQLEKRIEENPYIAEATISRKLPDTLKIDIKERQERYYVEYEEGSFAILDGQGFVLSKEITSKDLVGLVGLESDFNDLISRRESEGNVRINDEDLKKLDLVAKIVDTAASNEVLTYIKTIDISNMNDVKLNLPQEGKVVYMQNCSDLNTKIQWIKTLVLAEQGKSGIIFFTDEYSNENRAVFRENV